MRVQFEGAPQEVAIKEHKEHTKFSFKFLKEDNSLFYYFLIVFGISLLFYGLMLINNHFTLNYGGDYNAQYIPMAYHIHDIWYHFFQTGSFPNFDESIFLGVNSVNSNAYYGLFSPFNFIILMFPRSWIPWTIGLSSFIKVSCAALFFRCYMKTMGVKENNARLAGLAYAFCGFMGFYLWYNNYQDVLVFFPVVLLGIEKVLREKKPWILITGIFLLEISNYVLMVTYIICAFLYAMFRYFQRLKLNSAKDNLAIISIGFVGFVLGILVGAIIGLPSFLATLDSPKVTDISYLNLLGTALSNGKIDEFFKLLFDWGTVADQHNRVYGFRAYFPIMEFFFPTITCRNATLIKYPAWDFDDVATSFWIFIPLTLFLVPAFIKSIKEKKVSHILGVVFFLFAMFTPFIYFMLMGFTGLYGRWSLFFASSAITYVVMFIDKMEPKDRKNLIYGLIFALFGVIMSFIIALNLVNGSNSGDIVTDIDYRFTYQDMNYTWIALTIEIVYIIIAYILISKKYKKEKMYNLLFMMVALESAVMGNIIYFGQGSVDYNSHYNNNTPQLNVAMRDVSVKLKDSDKDYYRVYSSLNDAWSDNNTMMNEYNGVSYFHSLYNFNIDYFTQWVGIRSNSKAVGGRYVGKYQDLDNILGIKYYVLDRQRALEKEITAAGGEFEANVPFNYEYKDGLSNDRLMVYENNNYNNFASSYNNIISYNEKEKPSDILRTPSNGVYFAIENSIKFEKHALVGSKDAEKILEEGDGDITTAYNDPYSKELSTYSLSPSNNPAHGTNGIISYYQLPEGDVDICYNPQNHLDEIVSIPTRYTRLDNAPLSNDRHFVFITPRNSETFFNQGAAFYLKLPFSPSKKYKVFFIDENNKIIKFDDHNDYSTDSPVQLRGFYTDKLIKAIAIRPIYPGSLYEYFKPELRYETKSHYSERYDMFNDNNIANIVHEDDLFTFTTNYTKNTLVVTKVAYDKGWNLYSIDSNLNKVKQNTYLAQGGFVSFIAPKGETNFVLEYETPYLFGGSLLSAFGISASIISYVVYDLVKINKRKDLDSEIQNIKR